MSTVSLDSTFGCIFVATILTTALWGAGTVQLYLYYDKYSRKDKWFLKLFVFTVWALDTTLQVITIHSGYKSFVTSFGDFISLLRFDRESAYGSIFTAIIDALVQGFYCVRIFRLSRKNYILTGVVAILVTAQAALLIAYFGLVYNFTVFTQLQDVIKVEHAINATQVAAELLLSGTLVLLLLRSRSGVRNTDSVIHKLVMYTVSTGLLTGLCAVVALITEFASPDTYAYVLLGLLIPVIYMNSMLASLNSRESLRAELDGRDGVQMSIRTPFQAAVVTDVSGSTSQYDTMTHPNVIDVNIGPLDRPGFKSLNTESSPSDTDLEAASRNSSKHLY
ncbi:hypothetical protein PNOK_0447600 [Pyrrhoderma noxium]|uniref:DUF6534 domain-containing protein n=1 Tax=Pyrrhoderma noxium TaxID=2282107 RepID=A0A286UIX6_9AGAM|nr:hypothetical protein PNOK_0447600 [Pyrrhoderma noxium]